jgi:hypothetical protein
MILVLAWSGCQPASNKSSVRGQVLVNGRGVELINVQFHAVESSRPGNDRYPTAVTNADGSFEMSSQGHKDGVVPGDYVVTFTWLSGRELGQDLLQGKLANPATSKFKVTIPAGGAVLPPFKLNVDESQLSKPAAAPTTDPTS